MTVTAEDIYSFTQPPPMEAFDDTERTIQFDWKDEMAVEVYPYDRAIAYHFMAWPQESIQVWRNCTAGITNPGAALIQSDRCRALISKIIQLITKDGHKHFDLFLLRANSTDSEIEQMGDLSYICGHFDYYFNAPRFTETMRILIEKFRVRECLNLMHSTIENATDAQSLAKSIAMLEDHSRKLVKTEGEMLTPTPEVCVAEMDKKVTVEDTGDRIPTSFRRLARFVGDYRRTMITLVGAPPGNGKTAFAMQEIQCALEHGFCVDAFLFESTFSQFTDRYIARQFKINLNRFSHKSFTKDELLGIHNGMDAMMKFQNRLFLSEPVGMTPDEIDAKIQDRKQRTGKPCDLIVIDHLDAMNFPRNGKSETDYETRKRGILSLRNIAARENAAMLIVSQLSVDAVKNSIGKDSRLPTMDVFRGGTPTEAAKVVLVLNKNQQDMIKSDVVEQQIVICKANDGRTGFVRSLFLNPFAMHIEDSPENRLRFAAELESMKFDIHRKRKDAREADG